MELIEKCILVVTFMTIIIVSMSYVIFLYYILTKDKQKIKWG